MKLICSKVLEPPEVGSGLRLINAKDERVCCTASQNKTLTRICATMLLGCQKTSALTRCGEYERYTVLEMSYVASFNARLI
jgi:hypothetical protein